ncbi:hypothetical protein [Paenibacillus polymyxa]|uniref:hypothetical protein n=1 Tax=Paenibacillus polymyxa TaxID=1406 RepID=UPI003D27127D
MAGIKLHLRLAFADAHEVLPEKATITTAKKNDRTQMDDLIEDAGITHVLTAVTWTKHLIVIARTRYTS